MLAFRKLRFCPVQGIGIVETEFACTLSNGRAGFQALMDDAEAFLERRDVPGTTTSQIMIALDEIITNILSHGVRDGEPVVQVELRVADGAVAGQIKDDGIAFDPLQNDEPDTSQSVEDRPIGGLGIHLVRKMMDGLHYDRRHRQNRLQFHKNFAV